MILEIKTFVLVLELEVSVLRIEIFYFYRASSLQRIGVPSGHWHCGPDEPNVELKKIFMIK